VTKIITIIFSSILIAVAYNFFLLPHKILSSGIAGVSMLVSLITPFNTGLVNFALNLPLLILGYLKLGKRFMLDSILSVAVLSIALLYIPIKQVTMDPLISSVFGGVLTGIGVGCVFRAGASTGGFDIVGLLLTRKKEFPLGSIIFAMNAVVIFASGFRFTWDATLYTMVSIFATGKMIDTVHTSHIKLTLMIITSRGEEIKNRILPNLIRGITIVDGEGAFTGEKRKVLLMVISRYELSDVKKMIYEVDPEAFVNITQTVEVMGYFRRD
jgi:uncharacterized membrane-anchored protein YitT (DUF2179 family)